MAFILHGEARKRGCAALIALAIAGAPVAAAASEYSRFGFDEENDYFAPHNLDRHYSQGLRLFYLSGDLDRDNVFARPIEWLGSALPIFQPGAQTTSRHFNFELGQEIFTPQNKTLAVPDPRDRPYAGWLFGGVGWIQDSDQAVLDHVAVQLGTVGPSAFGKQTQNNFHLAIQNPTSRGWNTQLRDEPGLVLEAERKWRFIGDLFGDFSVDAIPSVGLVAGNIFTYGAIGGRLRFGENLRVDYGPGRNLPGPSGTDYANADYLAPGSLFSWNVFVGTEGRAVARNIFLDGNTWRGSRSVDKRNLVGDLEAGAEVSFLEIANLSYSYVLRSDEFYGQKNYDNFGTITASVELPF